MIDLETINKIKKLIDQGYRDYKIGKLLKISPNTVKKYRMELNKKQEKQESKQIVNLENPITELKGVENQLTKILLSQKMQNEEYKKWKKILEAIRGIIRENDDLISEAKEKAITSRDEQWIAHLDQNYVEKAIQMISERVDYR